MAVPPFWASNNEHLSFTSHDPGITDQHYDQFWVPEYSTAQAPPPNPPPPPMLSKPFSNDVQENGKAMDTNRQLLEGKFSDVDREMIAVNHHHHHELQEFNTTEINDSLIKNDPVSSSRTTAAGGGERRIRKQSGMSRNMANKTIAKLTGNNSQNGGGSGSQNVQRRISTEHSLYENTIRGPKIAHQSKFVEAARLKAVERANLALKKQKKQSSLNKNDFITTNHNLVSSTNQGISLSENVKSETSGFELFLEAKKMEWNKQNLHPRAARLRASTQWRHLGDGDPFTGRGRLYWNEKANQENKYIHHVKEVEWERKNPLNPPPASIKPARPIIDKREIFQLRKGVTGVRSDRVAKDLFETSLRNSVTTKELAQSLANNAAKPRGGTLAISRDAPVSAPRPSDKSQVSGSRRDEKPLPASTSTFLLEVDGDPKTIMGGGTIAQNKGPWRTRPRPEWERPWAARQKQQPLNKTNHDNSAEISADDIMNEKSDKTNANIKEEDERIDLKLDEHGDYQVQSMATGNKSKLAHYLSSWDAPLSQLISVEEKQPPQQQEKERRIDVLDKENNVKNEIKRDKVKLKQPPPILSNSAGFCQPTAAWTNHQASSSDNHRELEIKVDVFGSQKAQKEAKRLIGGGAPSFGLPFRESVEVNRKSQEKGRNVGEKKEGGTLKQSERPNGMDKPKYVSGNNAVFKPRFHSPTHRKKKLDGQLTPTSPPTERNVPLQQGRYQEHHNTQIQPPPPPDSQQQYYHKLLSQHHHQQQQQQYEQEDNSSHNESHHLQLHQAAMFQPQQPSYQEEDVEEEEEEEHAPGHKEETFLAQDASTDIGLDQESFPIGPSNFTSSARITIRKHGVETKTRSTSPFDEAVIAQVYPHHQPTPALPLYSSSHHHVRFHGAASPSLPSHHPSSSPYLQGSRFHTRRASSSSQQQPRPPSSFGNSVPSYHMNHPQQQRRIINDISGVSDINSLVSAMSGLMNGASAMMHEYREVIRPQNRKGKRQRQEDEESGDSSEEEAEEEEEVTAQTTATSKDNKKENVSISATLIQHPPQTEKSIQNAQELMSFLSMKLDSFDRTEEDIRARMEARLKTQESEKTRSPMQPVSSSQAPYSVVGCKPEFRSPIQVIESQMDARKRNALLTHKNNSIEEVTNRVEENYDEDLMHSTEIVQLVERMADELIDAILEDCAIELDTVVGDCAQAVFETV